MTMPIRLWLIMWALLLPAFAVGRDAQRERVRIGFYNLENFYDTIPSLFNNDSDYTPLGTNSWGTDRYRRKLSNLARVIDHMDMDVLGVCEVESEQALRDLVLTLRTDYNYVHRTGGDRRGMDIGMLYKGDKFTPQTIRQIYSSYSREFLYVRGVLVGERVDFLVCHMPSNFNSSTLRTRVMRRLVAVVDSLQNADCSARVIVMGDFNAVPTERLMRECFRSEMGAMSGAGFLFNPFYGLGRSGFGTYVYNDRWVLFDNIMLDNSFLGGDRLRYLSSGVFIKDYMISQGTSLRRGYPMRTFVSGKYIGGYSDHLPVYIFLER